MNEEELTTKVTELAKAKDAVRFCLDTPAGLVDMHGLAYWANRVEALRNELRGAL